MHGDCQDPVPRSSQHSGSQRTNTFETRSHSEGRCQALGGMRERAAPSAEAGVSSLTSECIFRVPGIY